MTSVHILTEGFTTQITRPFLFPVLNHKAALKALGIRFKVFFAVEDGLTDCDILFVDSKHYRTQWGHKPEQIFQQLGWLKGKVGRLFWFDTTDSTGYLQTPVLPYVDRYYKGQLLKDRSLYRQVWYGARIFTDYYHRVYGVEDEDPEHSTPLRSEELAKLRVSWSMALANHSYSTLDRLGDRAYRWIMRRPRVRSPRRWVAPSLGRPVDVSARFGVGYAKATVRYQRERIRELLDGRVDTTKVSRRDYFREMENSSFVLAPFGWGEFNYRDYHAFLSGSVLIKPDMGHLETWPDLYQDGSTILSFDWDMKGLRDMIESLAEAPDQYLHIALRGQSTYRGQVVGADAAERFATRLQEMLKDDEPEPSRSLNRPDSSQAWQSKA